MSYFTGAEQWFAAMVAIYVILLIWRFLVFSRPSKKFDDKILITAKGKLDEIQKMTDKLREIAAKHGAIVEVRDNGNIEIGQLSIELIDELGTVELSVGAIDVEI